ncbi:MAG: InlB B-repeat-containing protein, partial [Acholeplasmataceae bacterium]|nr:InlB B-repeat-containing protein [Acholeplasmataceae bacterium]
MRRVICLIFMLFTCFMMASCGEDEKEIVVSFNTNGGNVIEPISLDLLLSDGVQDPVRAGYTFMGWYQDEDFNDEITSFDILTKSITLYAKWELNTVTTYTITFQTNGGSNLNPLQMSEGSTLQSLSSLIKTGHTFSGWYFDSDFDHEVTYPFVVGSNLTLYAKYEMIIYSITFDTNGGTSLSTLELRESQTIETILRPTKTGYTFQDWYLDSELTNLLVLPYTLTNHITLYAKWEINRYTITFGVNGGNQVDAITVDYASDISVLPEPEKEGYQFLGWFTDISLTTLFTETLMQAHDVTLYAKWELLGVTITFDSQGGSEVSAFTGTPGDSFDAPSEPTREGFIFSGWFTSISDTLLYAFDTIPYQPLTLYANWATEGLVYQLIQNDEAYEVGVGDAIEHTTIDIPKYYQGKPVIKIMDQGFRDAENLNVITIPNTVTSI